jgi:DNA-binding response OmpR family regulator
MSNRHLALLVEDDPATADDLEQILASVPCDGRIVDNKHDALALCRSEQFCLVLLDLQIKANPDSIKGHRAHGMSLLQEIRKDYFEHTGSGRCYRLPVLIVSGYAREASVVLEVMKDGADGVIHKPFKLREVLDEVQSVFQRSGRATHRSCAGMAAQRRLDQGGTIVLTVTGTRERRRSQVLVGSRPVFLTDGLLRLLLRLMVARLEGRSVHKRELGATDDSGFKGISNLRSALQPALPPDRNVIGNDYHGCYYLEDDVVVGECNASALTVLGDKEIAALAGQITSRKQMVPKV